MLKNVSFRFLQAITNSITNDQITVGVLHWDENQIHFAGNSQKLAVDQGRSTVERALSAIREQTNKELHCVIDSFPHVADQLDGEGSMLRWGKLMSGLTSNYNQHFNDLIKLAGLNEQTEKTLDEALSRAFTRIAQHACRQGETNSRNWPDLSQLPEPENWKMVGSKYAREFAIELMTIYFSKGNFVQDLVQLAGRDSEL